MRVVFLTHNYPRTPGDLSGAFLETLATALVRRGIEVRVVAPSDEGRGGEETRGGVRIRRVRYAAPGREVVAYRGTMTSSLRNPSGLRAMAGLWRALRGAAREEMRGGADLVHAHWWVPSGWAAPPEAPMVLTCHGTDVRLLEHHGLARLLARPVFRRARVVTAVSAGMGRLIERTTGRTIHDRWIQPMPLDTNGYRVGAGGTGAVVIGRLSAQKRVDLAIGAIARLRESGRELPLTIVGDGAERPALERLASGRGVSDLVRFAGAVPPSEIAGWLRGAGVMMFPAVGEGFGLAAAEALMCGVPVVGCTDGGGVLDVIGAAGGGRRVAPDEGELGRAAVALLDDPDSRDLAATEGARWRAALDADRVAERCAGWYAEALGG